MDGIQLRLSDLMYAIRKRWKLIALLTAIGLLFGIILAGASYLQGQMSKNYEIETSVVFIPQNMRGTGTPNDSYADLNNFRLGEEMMNTVRYIMESERLMESVIDSTELIGITPSSIRSNLDVVPQADSTVMELSLTWRSAEEGIKIINSLIEKASDVINDTLTIGGISVIDEPKAKYIVGGSMNMPIWGIAAVIGMIGSIGIVILDVILRPTLINLKDVGREMGLELIGTVPYDKKWFSGKTSIITESSADSEVKTGYASAAYILKNRLGVSKQNHFFYVTSTNRGEGRTTTAANIAVQLAEMEHKVLLVDLDTRHPEIGTLFFDTVDYSRSLNALYRGEITEAEAVTSVTGYLDVLPVVMEHVPIPLDGIVFEMIEKIAKKYEYVVVDAPPAGEAPETMSINQLADACLFVIGFDSATKPDIVETTEKLDKSGIRIIGCIVNKEHGIDSLNIFSNERISEAKNKKKNNHGTKKPNGFEGVLPVGKKKKEKTDSLLEKLPEKKENDNNITEQEKRPAKVRRTGLSDLTFQDTTDVLSDDEVKEKLYEFGMETRDNDQSDKKTT